MKKEISKLWNIIQTPNQLEKQDCQCSVELRRLDDQNRSLKGRLKGRSFVITFLSYWPLKHIHLSLHLLWITR